MLVWPDSDLFGVFFVHHTGRFEENLVSSTSPKGLQKKEGRKEMFYLTTHSTHFIYSYMASNIW